MRRHNFSVLPKNILDLLHGVGASADAAGLRAYLVGGLVRDLLLGVAGTDIDVVIEGDAMALAAALAPELKARAIFHEKFKTASLTLKDGVVLDLVTARRETYRVGGALPDIMPATLKEDILRRDFTINALAMGLNADDFSVLRDDLGGARDLDAKLIRVMHQMSFVDDPTRILRAARYAVRYGFQFEALTQDCLDQAVARDVFKTITPARYFLELQRILEEKDPAPVLDLLASWEAVRYVPYDAANRARLLEAGAEWTGRMAALLHGLSVKSSQEILAAFNVSRSAQKKIIHLAA